MATVVSGSKDSMLGRASSRCENASDANTGQRRRMTAMNAEVVARVTGARVEIMVRTIIKMDLGVAFRYRFAISNPQFIREVSSRELSD